MKMEARTVINIAIFLVFHAVFLEASRLVIYSRVRRLYSSHSYTVTHTHCNTNTHTIHTGILTPPRSVNISLNEVAVFNCTAIATFIIWRVNGEPVANIRSKGFDDKALIVTVNETQNLRMRTLRVVGSPDSHNVSITCVALLQISGTNNFSVAQSEPALILVQGDVA